MADVSPLLAEVGDDRHGSSRILRNTETTRAASASFRSVPWFQSMGASARSVTGPALVTVVRGGRAPLATFSSNFLCSSSRSAVLVVVTSRPMSKGRHSGTYPPKWITQSTRVPEAPSTSASLYSMP